MFFWKIESMMLLTKNLRFEKHEYTNGYLGWFLGNNYVYKVIFPNNLRISLYNRKLYLLNNFNNCNFIFYKNLRKNQKFLNKQIYSYIYMFFKSFGIGINLYFKKILVLKGIGYQFLVRKNLLFIQVGASHLLVAKSLFFNHGRFGRRNNLLCLRSLNLFVLTKYIAALRNLQPPDIYKGKGIRYLKEVVRLKVRIKKKS